MITALAGGVGAARFLEGLVQIIDPGDLTVIGNTGDDLTLWGLHISPDIDTLLYTLAGIADREKGWGLRGDTFHALDMMRRYGWPDWFRLGDRDLATHIYRTSERRAGRSAAEITEALRRRLGVRPQVLPMTNESLQTYVITDRGRLHFQEYLVQRQAVDKVLNVVYDGPPSPAPAPGVLDALVEAKAILLCPSNPIASLGTILSVAGVREQLRATPAPVLAISPIVGGRTLKGPADRMLKGLGMEASAAQVARLYADFLDTFVLDTVDAHQRRGIETLGIKVVVADTVMNSLESKKALAATALAAVNY